ncbi:hypothetical protein [Bradyrhizobium sp. SRS-191]|uniref:hypothetical protein n=1 Tax=Bradyrhizobium sp. SRS-191 TaxID=2962606 RepID=UPI00211EA9F2|nr:hypothetical protein [Bradyrhizobium sp. SRS-191]
MADPIFNFQNYLNDMSKTSERLADANSLHGYDPVLRDSADKPLELGAASVNAIAHALTSAYLAHDHSTTEASALGFARELKSYFGRQPPEAWDTFKDMYNNQVGRNIADYAKKNGLPREQIQDLILDALSSGRLIATRRDPRIAPSFNGNPLNFEAPSGDAAPWTRPSPGFGDYAATITRVPIPAGPTRGPSGLGRRGDVESGPASASPRGAFADGRAVFPGGLPSLIASIAAQDGGNPTRDHGQARGLPGLIQDYLRQQPGGPR